MKICFTTNGVLPVPAVKGGAVENLVQTILDKNEEFRKFDITVLSVYVDGIDIAANVYKSASFVFFKTPLIVKIVDRAIFFAAGRIFAGENVVSYRYIFRRLFHIYRCYRYLREHNFDRIILENHHSLFLILKSKKLQKHIADKVYYHAHNQPYKDFVCKKQIVNCGHYITVSKYIRDSYRERYPNITSKFHVLKNAVDTKLFGRSMTGEERMAERKKYNIDENDTVILFVGRISKEKGILELAEAFLGINNPSLKLLIAGGSFFDTGIKSPLTNQLKNMLKPCINRVFFTGYIKYEEIWKLYHLADIGCFPSVWNEPAPLTCIESMAAGLPFITTNSGGIPEYARRDCAFILERNADLSANIKHSIEILLRDPVPGKKMGEKGREVAAEYNQDNYYRGFVNIVS